MAGGQGLRLRVPGTARCLPGLPATGFVLDDEQRLAAGAASGWTYLLRFGTDSDAYRLNSPCCGGRLRSGCTSGLPASGSADGQPP